MADQDPWESDPWEEEKDPWEEDNTDTKKPMVGPPTNADIAKSRGIEPMTGLGYAASEVPIAGPLVKKAIGAVSPKTEDELDLAKARYESENPNMATGLQMAAPFALPLGPARLGAQALYQGAIGAGDTLARGGSMGDAQAAGGFTAGATMALGGAGKVAAPALRKAGDFVDRGVDKSGVAWLRNYLRSKASGYAAEGVLAGQKKLNKELRDSGSRNVGEAVLDAGIFKPTWSNPFVGNAPRDVSDRTAVASRSANKEITNLIDSLTDQGINPTKSQVIGQLDKLMEKVPRTPDTASYLNYLNGQAEYLRAVPDDEFTLRFIQNRKNDIDYEPLAESGLAKGRRSYNDALQNVQDEVIGKSSSADAYKPMQKKAAGLIAAQKGSEELATRSAANSKIGLIPAIIGTGLGAGVGGGSGGDLESTLKGGVVGLGGAALARSVRQRGSGAMAANLNSLSKMARTKFGPMLEDAARRGRGALSVTHYLLYKNNPEYREIYNADQGNAE